MELGLGKVKAVRKFVAKAAITGLGQSTFSREPASVKQNIKVLATILAELCRARQKSWGVDEGENDAAKARRRRSSE